jgi:hypothetical protein
MPVSTVALLVGAPGRVDRVRPQAIDQVVGGHAGLQGTSGQDLTIPGVHRPDGLTIRAVPTGIDDQAASGLKDEPHSMPTSPHGGVT